MAKKLTHEELEQRVKELEKAEFERKNAVDVLRESEQRFQKRLDSNLLPNGDADAVTLNLADIIDTRAIQSMMDDFFNLTNIGIAFLDLHGKILVATGWQDICTRFHRIHSESCRNCLESDLELSNGVEPGTFRLYRCKNNMWDMATPITVDDKHVGNLYLGQFLFEDETPDLEVFRSQAQKYEFNEEKYLAALERVPRWSRETVNTVMTFYTKLAHMISELSYSNIRIAQTLKERNNLLNSLRESEEKYLLLISELNYSNVKTAQTLKERNNLLNSLRESEERYRTILESIEDGYFEVDLPGNLSFFNDALCKITGFSRDEIMGINNREYMDEETAKKVYETYVGIYETGEPVKGFEYEIRKDGNEKYVETSVSLRKDVKGQPIGFRGILRDVTERKRMEAELIQTKDFLQNILDSSIDGITSTDLEGNIIYSSSRAEDIIGYEREELAGKKVSPHYENGIEDAKKIMKKLKEKGELRDYEMRFKKKDGGLIDVNLSGSYLKNEKGEIIGTLGVYRDISDKKRLEAQLQQAQKMESIGTLAGGIAHNFNNLLMGIQGNASIILLDIESSNPRHKNLNNIEKLVENGAKLTAQLLGYAREGSYEVNLISLNQLVKETSDTFGMTKKEITVHQELSEKLYGIKADQGQIEQVLLNLYVNAADAMPGGGGLFIKTINVTDKDMVGKPYEVKPGNYVLLTVRDTGVGMDQETRERIFEPFFTTKGLASGTGLGMASAYGIIKGHGGYIDVDSGKGEGTTFSIYLPATEKMIEEKKVLPDELVTGKGTVLLVDDEEMVLDAGEEMLKHLGYEVLLAEDGQKAVELYKENQNKIDMVLLDMVMPVMGGGEAFDRMKEINTNVKVLLSSGYSLEGEAKEILKRGCDAFIQKPFKLDQLSQEIRDILGKK